MPSSTKRRFTYVGGGSNKFWEIYEPFQNDGEWVVEVNFGRIGGWAQDHQNVFHYQHAATLHYLSKIDEKLRKGYKEAGKVEVKKNVANYTAYAPPKPKPVPVCQHNALTRSGDKWTCTSCKKQVEFDKPATQNMTMEIMTTKVKRFFNLSARQSE